MRAPCLRRDTVDRARLNAAHPGHFQTQKQCHKLAPSNSIQLEPIPSMIPAIALLLICQLSGEALVRLLEISLPGPVVGLVLLAFGLVIWRKLPLQGSRTGSRHVPKPVHDAAHGILRNLSLLFVPAAVGIVQQADVLAAYGVALLVALIVSTVAAMVVAALTFKFVSRLTGCGDTAAVADSTNETRR